MASGQKDWSNIKANNQIFTFGDLGELAVRLGSIATYDRRGNVFWIESFESGITRWSKLTDGAGASVDWSTEQSNFDKYSVKLISGSSLTRMAQISRLTPVATSLRMGFEITLSFDTNVDYILIEVGYYDNVNLNTAQLKIDVTNKRLYVQTSGGAYRQITSAKQFNVLVSMFHHIKIVCDYQTKTYPRILFDFAEYQTDAVIWSTPDTGILSAIYCKIIQYSISNQNGTGYIDSCIFTTNEP